MPLVLVQVANSDLILLQVNLQPGIDNCKMVPVSITSDESIDSRHSFFSSENLKSGYIFCRFFEMLVLVNKKIIRSDKDFIIFSICYSSWFLLANNKNFCFDKIKTTKFVEIHKNEIQNSLSDMVNNFVHLFSLFH